MNGVATGLGALAAAWLSLWPAAPAAPAAPVLRNHAVCAQPAAGEEAACLAKVRGLADGSVKPLATSLVTPPGLSPAQLRSAYGVPASSGGRVAVVGAYDNPSAKSDLDQYSRTFGLPVLPSCSRTVTTSCFAKYDQRGGTLYPRRDRGWSFETALDIQSVHAVCPTCRIDLVEANSASVANLTLAVDRAVALGAPVVSMSWGANEFFSQTANSSHFNVPGVTFVAASGDSGYGASWPAAAGHVLATGGTTLTLNPDGTRASETAWAGSGSGCSAYEPKPAWQHDTGCARRTIADVSAVADPATGAAVFATYTPYGSGWFQVGGTSLSAPLIAAMVSVAGAGPHAAIFDKLYAPAATGLFDVTAGSNGSCSPAYLCTAGTGYDGPTGVGTPAGLSAL